MWAGYNFLARVPKLGTLHSPVLVVIQFHCPHCGKSFKVADEAAGRKGSCRGCGKTVRVPQEETSSTDELVLLEVVDEQPDTLPTFEPSVAGDGASKPYTELFNRLQQPESAPAPFALKGDQLGMSLTDFKRIHHQSVAGHDEPLPWCSDTRPGEGIETLMSEPYFPNAGLVNCRLDFPFQQIQGDPAPTIAGVETELLLYKFVDEWLYEILAMFSAEGIIEVHAAMTAKYGPPDEQASHGCVWRNDVSSIHLLEGRKLNQWTAEPSVLLFSHHELSKLAESRHPGPAVDDL